MGRQLMVGTTLAVEDQGSALSTHMVAPSHLQLVGTQTASSGLHGQCIRAAYLYTCGQTLTHIKYK